MYSDNAWKTLLARDVCFFKASVSFRSEWLYVSALTTLPLFSVLLLSELRQLCCVISLIKIRVAQRAVFHWCGMFVCLSKSQYDTPPPNYKIWYVLHCFVSPLPVEHFKGYMRQCREELAKRLCDRVYAQDGSRSKHWMLFSKRKFMGKEML